MGLQMPNLQLKQGTEVLEKMKQRLLGTQSNPNRPGG